MSALLATADLRVTYRNGHRALRGVTIDVPAGGVTAVIGESGSGKSTFARAVLGMLPDGARAEGDVVFDGTAVTRLPAAERRALRGRRIGYVPQDPVTNLDPLQRVGAALREALRATGTRPDAERVHALLRDAGLGDADRVARRYPHELSGGQRQRVLIALGLAGRPRLVVADEPTSALDVTVQKEVLDLLCLRAAEHGAGLLLVTHDIEIARERARHVVVLRHGEVVEQGPPERLGRDPYTRELLGASSRHVAAPRPSSAEAPVVLAGAGLAKTYRARGRRVPALDAASFELRRGETLGVVGPSGSGKSTLARGVLRLLELDAGELTADGTLDVRRARGSALRAYRRRVQPVFQNPYASLDPAYSVERTLREAVRLGGSGRHERTRVRELLELVGLEPGHAGRMPDELSGGQQQRVAIARSLAFEPETIVLDEAVSALDVVVQQRILDLLARLQRELGVAYLFVSHDLAVVRQVAHRVVVMRDGRIVEQGPTDRVFADPQHEDTRRLLDAIPGGLPRGGEEAG
ncbi:ABC transporter ATP-binding protein [Microbacterium betulae]|uniref:ABC transporter ATP-binding protein n=1 Tax=Microbacterium betulae TaxID=2981139 RepID=A0AA97FIB9_9MICO|nr:ABC transporter ATP-binding protein [Microbacterium sp. AB]WOF23443.1 ABC transporter ATP-binding protein [Microbacterium sp. AB]